MMISVHLPKTAGKSFEAALGARFGERMRADYDTYPINTPATERRRRAVEACLAHADQDFAGVECVHGHFMPLRYLLLAAKRPLTFVAWLRHPVQRLVSHYHYWQRTYDAAGSPALHRRVVEEGWTLERFCLGDEMRDLYCEFIWGFPLDGFDFVGITEHYDEDLREFAGRYLGRTAQPLRLNSGQNAGTPYELEPALRQRIENWHARDMRLYQAALAKRAVRRREHQP